MENISHSSCILTESYSHLVSNYRYFIYHVFLPVHVFFSLPGYIITWLAFHKQYKIESGYLYQLFNTTSKIFEMLAYLAWCSAEEFWPELIARYHFLIFWNIYIKDTVVYTTMLSTFMLTLCSAADRFFALYKPFKYRNINHLKHQIIALIMSLVISFGTSVQSSFQGYINQTKDGYYEIIYYNDQATLLAYDYMLQVRNVVFAVCVLCLIISNVGVVYLFRKQIKKTGPMMNDQKEISRRNREKTLILLTTIESIFASIPIILTLNSFAIHFYAPWCYGCACRPIGLTSDFTIMISDLVEIYVVFALSKQFRLVIAQVVPCLNRFIGSNQIQSLNVESSRAAG